MNSRDEKNHVVAYIQQDLPGRNIFLQPYEHVASSEHAMAATVGLRSGCRWALGAFGTRTQHFVGKQERCLGQMSKVGVRTRRVGLPMRARSMANQSGASKVRVDLVPCLTDNYSFLIHEPLSGLTAAVDPAGGIGQIHVLLCCVFSYSALDHENKHATRSLAT